MDSTAYLLIKLRLIFIIYTVGYLTFSYVDFCCRDPVFCLRGIMFTLYHRMFEYLDRMDGYPVPISNW